MAKAEGLGIAGDKATSASSSTRRELVGKAEPGRTAAAAEASLPWPEAEGESLAAEVVAEQDCSTEERPEELEARIPRHASDYSTRRRPTSSSGGTACGPRQGIPRPRGQPEEAEEVRVAPSADRRRRTRRPAVEEAGRRHLAGEEGGC